MAERVVHFRPFLGGLCETLPPMGGKVSEIIAIYEQNTMLDCASVEDIVSAYGVGGKGGVGGIHRRCIPIWKHFAR